MKMYKLVVASVFVIIALLGFGVKSGKAYANGYVSQDSSSVASAVWTDDHTLTIANITQPNRKVIFTYQSQRDNCLILSRDQPCAGNNGNLVPGEGLDNLCSGVIEGYCNDPMKYNFISFFPNDPTKLEDAIAEVLEEGTGAEDDATPNTLAPYVLIHIKTGNGTGATYYIKTTGGTDSSTGSAGATPNNGEDWVDTKGNIVPHSAFSSGRFKAISPFEFVDTQIAYASGKPTVYRLGTNTNWGGDSQQRLFDDGIQYYWPIKDTSAAAASTDTTELDFLSKADGGPCYGGFAVKSGNGGKYGDVFAIPTFTDQGSCFLTDNQGSSRIAVNTIRGHIDDTGAGYITSDRWDIRTEMETGTNKALMAMWYANFYWKDPQSIAAYKKGDALMLTRFGGTNGNDITLGNAAAILSTIGKTTGEIWTTKACSDSNLRAFIWLERDPSSVISNLNTDSKNAKATVYTKGSGQSYEEVWVDDDLSCLIGESVEENAVHYLFRDTTSGGTIGNQYVAYPGRSVAGGDDSTGNADNGAPPGPDSNTGVGATTCESLSGFFGWLACPVISSISSSIDAVNSLIQGQLQADVPQEAQAGLKAVWVRMRDLAYIILVPIMLVMVIGTALGVGPFDAYSVKKALPRMVIGVIFIALSWYICLFVLWFFLGTILLFLAVTFGVLVLRRMFIIALLLVSPLAILPWIFPMNNKLWKAWWDSFSRLLLVYPLLMVLITVGHVFALIIDQTNAGGPLANFLFKISAYVLPLAFIPAAFKFAGGAFATLSGMADNRSKGLFDRQKKRRADRFHRFQHDKAIKNAPEGSARWKFNRAAGTLFNAKEFGINPMKYNKKDFTATRDLLHARHAKHDWTEMEKDPDNIQAGNDNWNLLASISKSEADFESNANRLFPALYNGPAGQRNLRRDKKLFRLMAERYGGSQGLRTAALMGAARGGTVLGREFASGESFDWQNIANDIAGEDEGLRAEIAGKIRGVLNQAGQLTQGGISHGTEIRISRSLQMGYEVDDDGNAVTYLNPSTGLMERRGYGAAEAQRDRRRAAVEQQGPVRFFGNDQKVADTESAREVLDGMLDTGVAGGKTNTGAGLKEFFKSFSTLEQLYTSMASLSPEKQAVALKLTDKEFDIATMPEEFKQVISKALVDVKQNPDGTSTVVPRTTGTVTAAEILNSIRGDRRFGAYGRQYTADEAESIRARGGGDPTGGGGGAATGAPGTTG